MDTTSTRTQLQKYSAIIPGLLTAFIVTLMARGLAIFVPQVGAATLAILLGIVFGNTICRNPALGVGTKFAESKLLECSVVLLGLTVTFQTIGQIGWQGILYVLAMMSTVIAVAYLLGRRLGFGQKMALMMAGGNAVCGSSAIGAIAPAIRADDEEKGQIITLVNLLGTVMMLTLPFLGNAVFGDNLLAKSALLGGTLQSVGQVVAGASLISPATVQMAMLFKIMRIMMLVVVVALFTRLAGTKTTARTATSDARPRWHLPIQWYVLGFLLLCILNSTVALPTALASGAHGISTWFETIALAAIGLRLDFAKFMQQGVRFALYGIGVGLTQTVAALVLINLLKIN
ncbi:YeiH family protein [Lacticaseibacillus songhuajiangensis]|uniref:YeiH family protein n=1 Tax=Lacticaseibacillus songhuajiangensis TaxID=1296539 RepID=UPI001CDD2534|nr:putative sulfate exporter family transporter [Lacticaseibacillus songhuajiangensis]